MENKKVEIPLDVEFWGIDSVGQEEIIVSIPNSDYVKTYKLDRGDFWAKKDDNELIDDAVQMFHDDLINDAEDALLTRKAKEQNPHNLAVNFAAKKLLNIE